MATAPQPPSSATGSKHRTVITIVTLIGIVSAIVLLALWGRGQRARRTLDELRLRTELRRSVYRQGRKPSKPQGIEPSLLQSIPTVKYHGSSPRERQTKSLDLERGRAEAEINALSLVQSQLNLKAMHVDMSEVQKDIPRGEREVGSGKAKPEAKEPECPICTMPFVRDEPIRILPCGHAHHQGCVDRWLLAFSGTCPVW
jgi:hypothetical protein